MRRLIVPSVFVLLLIVAAIAGIAAANPWLLLSWVCLSPWAFFGLGRASVAALKGRRIAILTDNDYSMMRGRVR